MVSLRFRSPSYLSLTFHFDRTGSLVTTATWMRNFVHAHPAYKHDSVISEEINYDLIRAVDEIERGIRKEPTLLPESYVGSSQAEEGDLFKACCGDVMNVANGAKVEKGLGE
jgi:glutamate--cysteine ligase catalytic subunit